MSKFITITFKGSEKKHIYKTADEELALVSAVRDVYGKRACWFEDSGISSETRKFGQVGKPANGGHDMITDRIYIDID